MPDDSATYISPSSSTEIGVEPRVVVKAPIGTNNAYKSFLSFSRNEVQAMLPFGAGFCGFYLHCMISITGQLGYLERHTNWDSESQPRIRALNSDIVPLPDREYTLYFVTVEEKNMCIPLHEMNKNFRPMSQYSGGSVDSEASNTSNESGAGGIPTGVLRRDPSCVYTQFDRALEAAHLISRRNKPSIMTAICDDRLHLGGERMPAFEKIDVQLNSPYNGILLWQGIHGLMDSNNLALLRVPNFGMDSLTVPAHDVNFNVPASNIGPSSTVTSALLTEANLERLKPSPSWAGVRSDVYVVPFDLEVASMLPKRVSEIPSPIQKPSQKENNEPWPYNVFFDWAWGARIAGHFGTKNAYGYAEKSGYAMYLRNRSKRRHDEIV